MSMSQLSVLSAETAISFHDHDLEPYSTDPVVFVSVDDLNLANASVKNSFHYDNFLIQVQSVTENGRKWIIFRVNSQSSAEWSLLVQLRIKTGMDATVLNVVDKDIFKFDAFSGPVNVEVQTDDVRYLKFEMRVLNKLYLEHPKFTEGDQEIEFDDKSRIRVHQHILSTLSDYMAKSEKLAAEREGGPLIRVTNTEKEAFLELLYQAYPTRRPIYASFRALAAAAVGYKCDGIIYQLSKHLIEYNYKPLTFIQRLQAAIENRLEPAIRELAFRASQDGTWNQMIQQGFEAERFCGKDIYTKIICPAILAGRKAKLDSTTLHDPTRKCNFLELEDEADAVTKAPILFRGTIFYLNRGLLAAHGRSMFCTGPNGEFVARYTPDFQRECAREKLLPGEVLLQLLTYMQPFGAVPHPSMIRACIVFCHDHEWNVLKENLEQEMEPPSTADEYMSQLVFAEKFGLANLIRLSVQRAESSCHDAAELLERHGVLKKLSVETREAIMDRMCSGWGLNPQINRLATRVPTNFNHRLVNLQRGRAVIIGDGKAVDTLNSVQSEYVFGEPNELVIV